MTGIPAVGFIATPPRQCARRYSRTIEPHRGSLVHRWAWTVRVHNADPHLPILWATGWAFSRSGAEAAARRAIRRHHAYLERIMHTARGLHTERRAIA